LRTVADGGETGKAAIPKGQSRGQSAAIGPICAQRRRRDRPPARRVDAGGLAHQHRRHGGPPRRAGPGPHGGLRLPTDRARRRRAAEGWDAIPGARGCTNEACDFRDHHADLLTAGASAVYGLSTQSIDYQGELVERLGLPFAVLADPDLALADELGLPTFTAAGMTLYRRHTLVVRDGLIERVFYPVFPPDQHGEQVIPEGTGSVKPATSGS
jgi:hypothetical protein